MRLSACVLALVIVLAGCGSASDGGAADAGPAPPEVPANATKAQKAAIAAQTRGERIPAEEVTPDRLMTLLEGETGLELATEESDAGYELLTVPLTDQRFQTAYAFHADGRVMLEWLGGTEQKTDATFTRVQDVLARLDG